MTIQTKIGQPLALLVTGDREWTDRNKIVRRLANYPAGTLVIHGAARGADQMAGEVARSMNMPVVVVPYIGYLGRAGGAVRNQKMLDLLLGLSRMGYSIHAEAFHPDLRKSKGTKNMIKLLSKHRDVTLTVTS